jgi:hypothetical protein
VGRLHLRCRSTRLRLMGALSLTRRKPRGRSALHSTPGLASTVLTRRLSSLDFLLQIVDYVSFPPFRECLLWNKMVESDLKRYMQVMPPETRGLRCAGECCESSSGSERGGDSGGDGTCSCAPAVQRPGSLSPARPCPGPTGAVLDRQALPPRGAAKFLGKDRSRLHFRPVLHPRLAHGFPDVRRDVFVLTRCDREL